MNRSVLGPLFLIVLLVLGLGVENVMEKQHHPTARMLETAAQMAQQEDWPRAEQAFRDAKAQWEQGWKLSAALADHEPMEEIDGLFARLEAYNGEDGTEFGAVCRELARRLDAMAQAHSFDWWNIL